MNAQLQNQLVQAQLADATTRAEDAAQRLAAAQKLEADLLEARKALVLLAQTDAESAKALAQLKREAIEARVVLEDAELLDSARREEKAHAESQAKALQLREAGEGILSLLANEKQIADEIDAAVTDLVAKLVQFREVRTDLNRAMVASFPGGSSTPRVSLEVLCRQLRDMFNTLKDGLTETTFNAASEAALLNGRIVRDHHNFPKGI